jgi:hypothetical protein
MKNGLGRRPNEQLAVFSPMYSSYRFRHLWNWSVARNRLTDQLIRASGHCSSSFINAGELVNGSAQRT